MGSNKSLNANCLFTIFPRQIRAENEAQFYQLTRQTTADFLKIITEKPLNWILTIFAISTIFYESKNEGFSRSIESETSQSGSIVR